MAKPVALWSCSVESGGNLQTSVNLSGSTHSMQLAGKEI